MTQPETIPSELHRQQIEAYREEVAQYETYARVLRRVLENACRVALPEASVQARAKTLSSFAEKCARKYPKVKDAVQEFTDLCGARVIVQTLEQVAAVREFIESHFVIHERDDKALQLSEDSFGYRDLHYIVQILPEKTSVLGIGDEEWQAIGDRRAELQVRTWLQHAWADTFHDRLYKNPFTLSLELRRSGALLAALMEEGDRNFDRMVHEIDGLIANYSATAPLAKVEGLIAVERLLYEHEPDPRNKPRLALRLARLLAVAGDPESVVGILDPVCDETGAQRSEILRRLGLAQCRTHRHVPDDPRYRRGLALLHEALDFARAPAQPFVPDLRRRGSLTGRILADLGWAYEVLPGREPEAREHKAQAHAQEPDSPYYLADLLGYERRFSRGSLTPSVCTQIRQAIGHCRAHVRAGIEVPFAHFTAGRLHLLLGDCGEASGSAQQPARPALSPCVQEALEAYCSGLRYPLSGTYPSPLERIDDERQWIRQLHYGEHPADEHRWADGVFALARRVATLPERATATSAVLFIAGGAASLDADTRQRIEPLLHGALEAFSGKVVSGGTVSGIPGCVGAIKATLVAAGRRDFELVGYIPEHLPQDAPRDARYDRLIVCGGVRFSPDQILKSWHDLLDDGVDPRKVLLLGVGGGPLSAFEYALAVALGAGVGLVVGSGGAADRFLGDPAWSAAPNLLPLPLDGASARAFVAAKSRSFAPEVLEPMARAFHDNYVAHSSGRLPDNMKPWAELAGTYRLANEDQASSSVGILEAAGFAVRESASPAIFADFTDAEIERMAELEHGRWNVERLRNDWRFGPRNDARKRHDCLVPWSELPERIKEYDRIGVRAFPEILARAGIEVYRPQAGGKNG
ncbi:RyR domain-containing protein [Accumulibacter sp.]|uniref:RyR domain-containing protein n=1 Tax=Accumulibacter sp. TaxID=2053492 RepID=UPI0025EBE459|nr:RyR domain-containing protein [Accumulibacter sp.]MCM8595657.1 RyR domain-containing protein [Accumulibacter sp.]MCM8625999.1 RyR domain-containing protein [Accumulibacter sp.]MDS4049804.1 RyR domain-containing protein [Accumulibacter sp.]